MNKRQLEENLKRPWLLGMCALVLMTTTAVAFGKDALSLVRHDQQTVPVTAYAPTSAPCRGIAVVSHGVGGSEKGYSYLGDALARLGYLAVVVGHAESGRQSLREQVRGDGLRAGLEELLTDPAVYRARFMDIAAARQWAQHKCKTSHSVLVGHSMGAATVMMEAGAQNRLGIQGSDAFDAYIALSPQGPGVIFPENAWAGIKQPVLSLTGTRDHELGGASWQARTAPFKNMSPGCKWLGVIEGATHMNFAGHGLSRRTEKMTAQTIGLFLDGVRRGDCKAPVEAKWIEVK